MSTHAMAARYTGAYLHEVLLGLVNAGHVVKGDASVGLHLELGLGLAKGERIVAAGAPGAALRAPRQQEEAAHQQQRERQVACSPETLSQWPSKACSRQLQASFARPLHSPV